MVWGRWYRKRMTLRYKSIVKEENQGFMFCGTVERWQRFIVWN